MACPLSSSAAAVTLASLVTSKGKIRSLTLLAQPRSYLVSAPQVAQRHLATRQILISVLGGSVRRRIAAFGRGLHRCLRFCVAGVGAATEHSHDLPVR